MAVAPRRPKGPHLNALRAFEAAARLESFVSAAEELGVTAGAVSQHIKALEVWAGTTLFERGAHGVSLSSSGRKLAAEFTHAFDLLAAATQSLRNLAPNPDIHIAALPSIAQLWLPSRLGKLREKRPDLNVSVTALESPPSLSRELYDLSVFFSVPAGTPDQIVLAKDEILPVCSPKMADVLDLEAVQLLHDQTWEEDWSLWSEATGVSVGDPQKGPRYSLYALAVEEAKSGAGVLMGHSCLVEQALQTGQLKKVSSESIGTGRVLALELPHRSRRHPEIDEVVSLLREEGWHSDG
ncbi:MULTISPECIES: LysR family transcriptional regulator [unclassified Ruegeria]|uniref:LysR family transcriptional regulator n=1 Tax=unclassified Ruegeria TaxID=2625375 RepID=UPI0014878374|nr:MULTISPECIES: LysR family transcriptional regulator [unclassified Ruegeria]NOD75648.1 LysR family transcriptional regulator [Ruegeria sp. HKCCD4332]NOD89041.1 LysR family transcriptional regulator [Ruegeria sp. HKCCD4318]NOE14373.1 LysR family transcriptional regulator [Ruegeria sp. HKCCD4318-2]NOG10105.1 LysR family transcriptional regulator [Ruegeria sp. HKCCD4315]